MRSLGFSDETVQNKAMPRFTPQAAGFARHSLSIGPSDFALIVQSPGAAKVCNIIGQASNHEVVSVIVKEEPQVSITIVCGPKYLTGVVDVHGQRGRSATDERCSGVRGIERSEAAVVIKKGYLPVIIVWITASRSVM